MEKRVLLAAGFVVGLGIVLGTCNSVAAAEPTPNIIQPEDIQSPTNPPPDIPATVPAPTPARKNVVPVRPRVAPARSVPAKKAPVREGKAAAESPVQPMARDNELRQASAERLAALGYKYTWDVYTLEELLDKENRIRTAERLRSRGVDITWTTNSWSALLEVENRLLRADRLLLMGKAVDWKKYSADQLAEMEVELCRQQARK